MRLILAIRDKFMQFDRFLRINRLICPLGRGFRGLGSGGTQNLGGRHENLNLNGGERQHNGLFTQLDPKPHSLLPTAKFLCTKV